MEEGIFSSKPRSFRMDVRSAQASKLKASVSEKLLEFLGNYTDDVLAEYIVVLVCNGKHQNQARDDLEAFLGDKSGKFVAWLWRHLSEEASISKLSPDSVVLRPSNTSANVNDVTNKNGRVPNQHINSSGSSHTVPSKDGKYGPPTLTTNQNNSPVIKHPDDLQRWNPGLSGPSTEADIEETQPKTRGIHRASGAATDNQNEATRFGHSLVRSSSEISAGEEQVLRFENHYQKNPTSKSTIGESRPLSLSPRRRPVLRSLQSVITEDPHSRRPLVLDNATGSLSSKAIDAVLHQNTQPRGNVWDRLGKPCADNDVIGDAEIYQHDMDFIKQEEMVHTGKGLDRRRSTRVVPGTRLSRSVKGEATKLDNNHTKHVSSGHGGGCLPGQDAKIRDSTGDVSFRWKRQSTVVDHGSKSTSFSDHRESDFQDIETPKKLQRSSSARSSRADSLSGISAVPGLVCHSVKYVNITSNTPSSKRPESHLTQETSMSSPVESSVPVHRSAKPEPINYMAENAEHRPEQSEILDLKLKLQQVEMEMLMLRSKQAKMCSDPKPSAALGSGMQGVQNHFEDADSRIVFVTNVHFAASKEALALHFTKCGPVAKVILFTDTLTGQPKGSACITFASKDAAEKALSISGTSFLSRTLKVVRKAEMPAGILESKQPTGKPLQTRHPQSHSKGSFQRQHSSTHLQWRRDETANGETSSTAA